MQLQINTAYNSQIDFIYYTLIFVNAVKPEYGRWVILISLLWSKTLLYYSTCTRAAMIATIKQQIALRFKKFIIVFTIAILFEPIFLAFDSFSNILRFA